jgi:serine/threonine protein kinase
MSVQHDAFRDALADRYTIERELGAGGMATVYLAHDQKLGRAVALKVLKPELAAALGPERFLREIAIAAKLTHPNILGLYDCGTATTTESTADGQRLTANLLYYTMPYVEGESLRDRLTREKQLPLDDALQITKDVADALGYAHSLGLVHRDIKPENILFQAGHALVADFGIAKAIAAAGSDRLTETGLAIGTPAYMSPEQAAGNPDLDGRSDLYSLGCVLYEMLSGETPYTGPSAQAILAKKLSTPVPLISVVRETVPPGVEAALRKVLAKTPADRWPTAAQFRDALAPEALSAVSQPRVVARRRRRTGWVAGAATIVLLAAAAGLAMLARGSHQTPASSIDDPLAIDSTVVAVLPFRLVSTDTSSTVRQLALGLPELFATKITGEFGRRISHTGTVQRLWREAGGTLTTPLDEAGEITVARTVGAGRLIRGTLVATDTGYTLTAEMVEVPGGAVRVQPTSVEGRRADWLALVDTLVWKVLARDQGISAELLPRLARYKPRAIQAYLAALQTGDIIKKSEYYHAAMAADSTWVVAALSAYGWGERDETAARYAWRHQAELTPAQRAYLLALAGWRFGATRSQAERIAQFRALVQTAPGSGGYWTELGTNLAGGGPLAGVANWRGEARRALETAVRLGPKNVYGWLYLTELAFLDEDTALVQQRLDSLAASAGPVVGHGSGPGLVTLYQWRLAAWRGDSIAADRLLRGLADSIGIPYWAAASRRGLATADRVAAALGDRFMTNDFSGSYFRWRGHFHEWRQAGASGGLADVPIAEAAWSVRDALFLDAPQDSTVAARAGFLERVADGDAAAAASPTERAYARCWSALWRVAHGDTSGAARAVRHLEREVEHPYSHAGCVGLITLYLTRVRGGNVHAALLQLDSVIRDAPLPDHYGVAPFPPPGEVENLTVARLLAQYGDTARALAASRRRYYLAWTGAGWEALPDFLREEGRLAAQTGDRDGAIRAYTDYLALRDDPDYVPWQKTRDSVRAELAALTGGR